MKNGFTYKGIHSDEFGIVVKTQDRPIIPAEKTKFLSPLYMDGAYDFSAANPYGRCFYDRRTFSLVLQISGENLEELYYKLNRIAVWLMGEGELIFDDTPNVRWAAKCENSISFAPERRGKKAVITVPFSVSPFGSALWGTLDDIILDTDIPLSLNIPLDLSMYYIHTFTVPAGTADKTRTIGIPNYGGRPIRPVITVTAPDNVYFTYVKLTCGGNTLIAEYGAETETVLDFNLQKVTGSADNAVLNVQGNFFELGGVNPAFDIRLKTVNGNSSDADCEISVGFTPSVIWDLDFDSVDWGDGDA